MSQKKLKAITVYLNPEEYDYIATEAEEHGVTVSAYVRARLGFPVTFRGAPEGNQNRAKPPAPRAKHKP